MSHIGPDTLTELRDATREEVAETLGVSILMDGGPATIYGPRALEAFDSFATPASD